MAVAGQTMTKALPAPGGHETTERVWERPAALPALTGLRFVAALPVVLCHLSLAVPGLFGARVAGVLVAGGYEAVSLFFILSGFILAHSYLGADGTLRGTRRAFYRARFARIYPVYVLAVVLAALPFAWGHDVRVSAPLALLATLTMTQAWLPLVDVAWLGPGWSLSCEALFYALFGLLARRFARVRRLLLVAALWWLAALAVPALYLLLAPDGRAHTGDWAHALWLRAVLYNPLVRLPEFVLGVALGRLWARGARLPRPGVALLLAAGLLPALVALSGALPYALAHNGLLDPLFAVLLYALAQGPRGAGSWLARALARPGTVLLGEASYALYLIHAPLLATLDHLGLLPLGRGALLAVPVAIGLSVLVYRHLERPARRALLAGVPARRARRCSAGGGVL